MNLTFESERAWFARESRDDRSCPRSTHYAVLLPDASEQVFRKNTGLKISDFGATDGAVTAVKLEDGHYALVLREHDFKRNEHSGPYIIDTSDSPAVTFAIWHASDMPMPYKMARGGRQTWFVPGIGKVYMYYNEKKEDMYYEPDHLGNNGSTALALRFGGYPIVLEREGNVPFSLNHFLSSNRLYVLAGDGQGKGKFVRSFLGSMRALTGEIRESRWNREIDPKDVVKRIGLLAKDLDVPILLVRQGDDGVYRREGPFTG